MSAPQAPAPTGLPFSRLFRQAGETAGLFLYRPDRRAIFRSSICALLEAFPSERSVDLIGRLVFEDGPFIWWPWTIFLLKYIFQMFSLDVCSWAGEENMRYRFATISTGTSWSWCFIERMKLSSEISVTGKHLACVVVHDEW